MLILNDVFGVLSCVLVEYKLYSIGDLYISELVMCENLRFNGIDELSVKFFDSIVDYL